MGGVVCNEGSGVCWGQWCGMGAVVWDPRNECYGVVRGDVRG